MINRKINFLFIACVVATISITITACDKDGINDYAPERPIGGYTSSAEIAPASRVAYWAFENSLADSVAGLAGTASGTTFVAGKKGQALQVGGSNYLLFNSPGTVIPTLKTFTISFWMNAPQNTSYGYGIFSLNNPSDFWGNLDIYLDNGGTADTAVFKVHINNAGVGQFSGFKLGGAWNKWVHLAIVYDSSRTATTNFKVFANGQLVYSTLLKNGTANYGPLAFANPTKMVIGTWQFQTNPSLTSSATSQSWAGSFGGAIDEFRIYSKVLSDADVNSLYKLEALGR
jgi:hypothetical protein